MRWFYAGLRGTFAKVKIPVRVPKLGIMEGNYAVGRACMLTSPKTVHSCISTRWLVHNVWVSTAWRTVCKSQKQKQCLQKFAVPALKTHRLVHFRAYPWLESECLDVKSMLLLGVAFRLRKWLLLLSLMMMRFLKKCVSDSQSPPFIEYWCTFQLTACNVFVQNWLI